MEQVMRRDRNMILRGAVWSLRIAVPKRLQDLRAEQGLHSPKEVWRSLGTGDRQQAQARLARAKAEVLEAFEKEQRSYLDRTAPTIPQLKQSAAEFGELVRTSLYNERVNELPLASEVDQAVAAQQAAMHEVVTVTDPDMASELEGQICYYDTVITAAEDQQEARAMLLERLQDDLARADYRTVEPFIQQIARFRGYRIERGSPSYRQLAPLLTRTWIAELVAANGVFQSVDAPLVDQDDALAAWESGALLTKPVRADRDIRCLFDRYLAERHPKIARNALQDRRRTIEQFVEIAGLKDIGEYRKVDMTAYKQALARLPVNAGRDYPGMTMQQVTEKAPASAKRLAPKTIQSRLSIMGSFGRWLSENIDGIDDSNFRTSAPPIEGPETPVREFSDAEICKILTCPAFTGCQSERNQMEPGDHRIRDYRYWLPMLGAFTGCRLNELAQLRVVDVLSFDGLPALKITDDGPNQNLKTHASERLVPIHSSLVEAGFLAYVNEVRSRGWQDLFEDIPVGRTGRRAEAAGKWFRKFLKRLGVKTSSERGGFHRFRHTVIEKLRSAGHWDHEISPIVGHSTGLAPMTAAYGSSKQMLLSQRRAVLESLSYLGVEPASQRGSRGRRMVLPVVAGFSGIGLVVIGPWLTKNVVDAAVDPAGPHSAFQGVVAVALAGIAGTMASLASRRIAVSAGVSIGRILTQDLLTRVFSLPLAFFARQAPASIAHRLYTADDLRMLLLDVGSQAASQALLGTISLFALALLSPPMAAIALVAAIATTLLERALRNGYRDSVARYSGANQAYSIDVVDAIHCMQPIQLAGVQAHACDRLLGLHDKLLEQEASLARTKANHALWRGLLSVVYGAAMLLVGAMLLGRDILTLGDYVAAIAYAGMVGSGLGTISSISQMNAELFNADGRIGSLLRRAVASPTENARGSKEVPVSNCTIGELVCDDVQFAYSRFDPPVFSGLSIRVARGECVAIVASSGTGKSTLAKLIVGAVHPQGGEIWVNGRRHEASDAGARGVATVMQDDRLITGTFRQNIDLFRGFSMREIENAAKLACIHEVIDSMPMRYETVISDSFSGLSGGQRQRVLLARALLCNPEILLLDEATSALDAATEKLIMDSIRDLSMTRVLFTHRRESIDCADRVYQLVDGCAKLLRPAHGQDIANSAARTITV